MRGAGRAYIGRRPRKRGRWGEAEKGMMQGEEARVGGGGVVRVPQRAHKGGGGSLVRRGRGNETDARLDQATEAQDACRRAFAGAALSAVAPSLPSPAWGGG